MKSKVLFYCIFFVLLIVVIELVSIPVFYSLNQKSLSKKKVQSAILELARTKEEMVDVSSETANDIGINDIIHPYVGFVKNPDLKSVGINNQFIPINQYGFLGDYPDNRNSMKILLLGGSVAEELFVYAKGFIEKELNKNHFFQQKKIQITTAALSGFKQPQQLMALNYFLSLGQQFDIVINLDGFNEIALPYCENKPLGIAPFYPRNYSHYTSKTVNSKTLFAISEIYRSKLKLKEYANYFSNPLFKSSYFGLCIWLGIKNNIESTQLEYDLKLKQIIAKRRNSRSVSAQERGPDVDYKSLGGEFNYFASSWARCSILLSQICEKNDISYYHFLQPNQYVRGSKNFTDWEKTYAMKNDHCYKEAVEKGYSYLRKYGELLTTANLKYYDFTNVFQSVNTDVYRDACCHYNNSGYTILAENIAKVISKDYQLKSTTKK